MDKHRVMGFTFLRLSSVLTELGRNIAVFQVKDLLMWWVALTMLHQKFCGRIMVQNVMFGVPALLSTSYSAVFHHFGTVRISLSSSSSGWFC